MTTSPLPHASHVHFLNHHTGRPRFHFDESGGGQQQQQQQQQAPVWHEGVAPEVKGFWQNKGLPLDDPKAFSTKLTELYQQAEKFIGVPPDQIVRVPKADAKPEDIRAYYTRLGAPAEAKDYDLSALTEASLADALRPVLHDRGVTKDAATAVAAAVAKAMESKATQDKTLEEGKVAEERTKLQQNWGDKYNYNHLQAIEGARRLGITPEGVKALEGQIGYAAVMEAMRKIGASTSEHTFVERGAGGSAGDVTTLEGAKARKAELMADPGWVDRYLKGGQAENREMTRLNQMITGATA